MPMALLWSSTAAGVISTVIVGLISLVVCWKLLKSQAFVNFLLSWSGKILPPVQGGHIPWLGCAVSFGKEPLHFIQRTHKKVVKLRTYVFINIYFIFSYTVWRYFYDPSGWKVVDFYLGSKYVSKLFFF